MRRPVLYRFPHFLSVIVSVKVSRFLYDLPAFSFRPGTPISGQPRGRASRGLTQSCPLPTSSLDDSSMSLAPSRATNLLYRDLHGRDPEVVVGARRSFLQLEDGRQWVEAGLESPSRLAHYSIAEFLMLALALPLQVSVTATRESSPRSPSSFRPFHTTTRRV